MLTSAVSLEVLPTIRNQTGQTLLTTCMHAKSVQSCLTLCDPTDCSPPGFSIHGILQARILEWLAMPSSRRSSWPRDSTHVYLYLHWQVGSWPLAPPRKPTGDHITLSRVQNLPDLPGSLEGRPKRFLLHVWWPLGFPSGPVVKNLPAIQPGLPEQPAPRNLTTDAWQAHAS